MAESTAQETLASEGLSPTEDTSPAAPELTDDQLWDQVGQPPAEVEDVSDDVVETSSTTEEEEESEVFEVEAPSEPTAEEKKEEHNYEKRYKDLEKEFHRRNEETKDLREQFQQLRLERLEIERQLEKAKVPPAAQEETKPKDPTPLDEDWFDPATKQTLDEFQELTSAYRKLIAHEIAKATKNIQMPEVPEDRIGQLEEIAQQYKANQYRLQHAAHMRTTVGDDYMDIDKSQEFYDYVNSSPIRLAAMTQSMNPEDHAAVMNDFLNTPAGREKFRTEPAPTQQPVESQEPPKETQGAVRRKAAQGLLKNSNPRQSERRPEDMNDEELWESIAV
jgi:hypothetical protein